MNKDQDNTQKLEALLEAAIDAIITIDEDGIIESVNSSAKNLFDYKQEAFIGRNVNFLMPEPWASAHDGYLWNYRKTGRRKILGFGREVEGLKSDGTVFPMHLSVSEYKVQGKTYYTGIVHDLTERKKTEASLYRMQKMESIGQLTGGIAHDFNNLLTVITGNLELLEMQLKDDSLRDILKEAQEAADLGADLTAQLLAFARRSVLTPEIIDLNSLVRKMSPMLERTLGAKINLKTSMQKQLWNTLTDAGQVESVILNLAVNARDAMPSGGQLIIETKNVEIDNEYAEKEFGLRLGDYVCLTVSDTGEGMSEEIREQVFEPFFSTKETGKGTGLGLAMVYGFAKQSGGHVAIYSEVGLGSTINLYLPRATEIVESEKTDVGSSVNTQTGNRETILIVEDDPRVLAISVQRLEQLNYNLIVARNGDEALQILKKNQGIDLVFTDLVMPGNVSGYDVVDIVQNDYPEIAVLMTSGYAEDLIHSDRLINHNVKLLRKPYRQADLAKYVYTALHQKA